MQKEKIETQKGITLIALIIAIIVMLILIAVTVNVALKGGLFSTAEQAKTKTQTAINEEERLSTGEIKINGLWYNSMEDYLNNNPKLPKGWKISGTKQEEWKNENVIAITDGKYTIPLPEGYQVSMVDGQQEVETGLVITDGTNEFVWIPVTDKIEYNYSSDLSYSEPKTLTDTDNSSKAAYDSQEQLDYYYGKDYYKYNEDFKYEEEYKEMVTSVNKYNGFYIGRYETTIDEEGNIGSKYNTKVLLANDTLKDGINQTSKENYYYRWYGLYYVSKNANVTGNKTVVQAAMIYGVLWDETMDFIRKNNNSTYDVDTIHPSWHQSGSVKNSGQANSEDLALNIWDLESNAFEWSQEEHSTCYRVGRSCGKNNNGGASYRFGDEPNNYSSFYCSRLVLYIKN